MIRFTTQDVLRAAEALSFHKLASDRAVRSITKLSSQHIAKLSSDLSYRGISTDQFRTADRMGRQMAKIAALPLPPAAAAAAAVAKKVIPKAATGVAANALRSGKRVLTGHHVRQLFRPVTVGGQLIPGVSAMPGLPAIAGDTVRVGGTMLKGRAAFMHRLSTNPGEVATRLGKGVVAPAAGLYAAHRVLSSNDRK